MSKILLYKLPLIISQLLISYSASYAQNNATASDVFILHKSNHPIKIDGLLNEPVWKKASFLTRFYSKDDSVHFYSNTKAWLTYDDNNLYVGFLCAVKDTSKLSKKQYAKDDEAIKKNEWVAFCADTYNEGLNAFAFFTDVANNQLTGDLIMSDHLNYSFSTAWTSAVHRNKTGYSVEMKIPLKKLPVKWNKGNAVIAVRLVRYDKENDREIQKPFVNQDLPNRIAQYQKIILKGIKQTKSENLSGVDMQARMHYKMERSKHYDLNTQRGRATAFGDASVIDYAIFKSRTISGAEKPVFYPYALQTKKIDKAFEGMDYLKGYPIINFKTFLEQTKTSAFIVISNDTVIYEKYLNGFNKNSIFTSFSVAKSFLSTLVGLAIADGYIKSDTDKITTYIPELLKRDKRFGNITIKDLLCMSSGIYFSDDDGKDGETTYDHPNMRTAALDSTKIEEAPGKHWLYDDYHPLLLGIILERTTHMTVSKYMEQKLWRPMGGGNASWSLDQHGFEKMESGINCSAYDYARLGELFLHQGNCKGKNVIPVSWIHKATQPQYKPEGWSSYLARTKCYYGYFWWGKLRENNLNGNDFFAMGNKGEYIYICPDKNLVIIRLGFEFGLPGDDAEAWPGLFYKFATEFKSR